VDQKFFTGEHNSNILQSSTNAIHCFWIIAIIVSCLLVFAQCTNCLFVRLVVWKLE